MKTLRNLTQLRIPKRLVTKVQLIEPATNELVKGKGFFVVLAQGWAGPSLIEPHIIRQNNGTDTINAIRDATPCLCEACV
jgi:hypothetical protein